MIKYMFIAILMSAFSLQLQAKVVKTRTQGADPVLAAMVDSIDYRNGLTRIYITLVGAPHTSGRIDGVAVVYGKKSAVAQDIDGVDFKRYFQWEDDGAIPVEIDFAPMKPLTKAQLVIDTPRGKSITTFNPVK